MMRLLTCRVIGRHTLLVESYYLLYYLWGYFANYLRLRNRFLSSYRLLVSARRLSTCLQDGISGLKFYDAAYTLVSSRYKGALALH